MTDAFDDRRKALEDEYFHRKEKETLEKLRAKLAADAQAASLPACPKCDGKLVETEFEDIHLDRCANCGGVWLDAGELEHLTKKEEDGGGFLHRLFG